MLAFVRLSDSGLQYWKVILAIPEHFQLGRIPSLLLRVGVCINMRIDHDPARMGQLVYVAI